MMDYLISAIIGYLFGCLQTSYILGKIVGKIDIRDHGSSNAGASNITTKLGVKWGALTLLTDLLKAVAAIIIIRIIFQANDELLFSGGAFVILGHMFPFFMQFRGGKGVASLFGMFLAIDWRIGLTLIIVQIVVTFFTDYVAIGSITLYLIIPALTFMLQYSYFCITICICISVIGLYKHISNLKKIRSGDEIKTKPILLKKFYKP